MIAAQQGHPECMSILLDHGADLNVTLEVSACSCGSWAHVHGAEYSCFHHHCLCAYFQDGFTALMSSAHEGHQKCTSTLLFRGAEVDKANVVSPTCIENCDYDCSECLPSY